MENVVEAVEAPKYPELSLEQKLAVRDAQVLFAVAKEEGVAELQAHQQRVNENIKAKQDAMAAVINGIGLALGIKDAEGFDLATLKFN